MEQNNVHTYNQHNSRYYTKATKKCAGQHTLTQSMHVTDEYD
jgi:hypothetical protein